MENNYDFTTGVGGMTAPAIAVKKSSKAPIVITLVCMFLAGCVAAGVLFFLKGGGSASYERAERNSLKALTSGFSSLTAVDFNSVDFDITITPSSELYALMGGMPDLGSFSFGMEAILDGEDIFASLAAGAFGIDVSMSVWQIGEQLILQFPEMSKHYILLDMADMMGGMSMMDVIAMNGLNFDYNEDAIMKELGVIGEKIADKYFELTKDVKPAGSEEVRVGSLSRNCDMYEIIVDGEFIIDILKVGFEAFLDSRELMKIFEDTYNASNDPYKGYSWYQSFDDMIDEARDQLRSLRPRDFDMEITMRVFISGNDVVKRDIIFGSGRDAVTFSFASINDKNGDYAVNAKVSLPYGVSINYKDSGNTNKDGAKTGKADFSFSDGYDNYTLTFRYDELKIDSNGMFSGDLRIILSLDNDLEIELRLKGSVSGNSQKITGSLTVFGMKAVDIEINYSVGNKKVTAPAGMNNSNTLDANDWRAMELFEDELMEWLGSLGNMDFLEDFLYEMRYMPVIGDLYWALSGSYYDGYDWGEYCFECYSYHEWWEDCYDWCTYDSDCWCDNCYDINYGWDDNYCYNCGFYDCWGDCYYDEYCDDCGNYHWDDPVYDFYILSSQKAAFKIMLGNLWNERTWNNVIIMLGDCAPYIWDDEWLDIFYDLGYDLYDLYDDMMSVIYWSDWEDYMGYDTYYYYDYYYWNAAEWENFYRLVLSGEGFAF